MDEFVARIIAHKLMAGLGYGLLMSVHGVFLVEKSLSLWQIGVLIGSVGALAVLLRPLCERLAERTSRIAVFQLSRLVLVLAVAIAIPAGEFASLFAAALLLSASLALATGTINIWILDQTNKRAHLDQVNQIVPIFHSALAAGLIAGAVLGGYMPTLMPTPDHMPPPSATLIAVAGVAMFHFALSGWLFREGEKQSDRVAQPERLFPNGRDFACFAKRPILASLILVGLIGGAALSSLEAYWQPVLANLSPVNGDYAAFGYATAAMLGAAMAGPLVGRWLQRAAGMTDSLQLLLATLLCSLVLWELPMQSEPVVFLGLTVLVVFLLALATLAALGIVGGEIGAPERVSVTRMFRSAVTLGMALSATFGAVSVAQLGLDTTWQGLGYLSIASALLVVASGRGEYVKKLKLQKMVRRR